MPTYYSQHGEDFILDLIFADQSTGFFVEVGCIDGCRFSNTLMFEERGWKGLCVEAHAGYIDALQENRPNSIICHCAVGEENADGVPFYANDRGSLSTLDQSREEEFRSSFGEYFSGFDQQTVDKRRLDRLFEEHDVPDRIDFLSLDIEGYEVEALAGMDLTTYRPRVLVVESDTSGHERRLDNILVPAGYEKRFRLHQNVFYFDELDLARRVSDDQYTVTLTHTRHPLDDEEDQKRTVELSLHRYGLVARTKQLLCAVYERCKPLLGISS
jgi:FkbM family methyltransferase